MDERGPSAIDQTKNALGTITHRVRTHLRTQRIAGLKSEMRQLFQILRHLAVPLEILELISITIRIPSRLNGTYIIGSRQQGEISVKARVAFKLWLINCIMRVSGAASDWIQTIG
ncbi:hypothetical protein NW754_011130 [Fusarium falciforme]|nr:hypothetical protein NW754_011130 [Fusarium falciforme]